MGLDQGSARERAAWKVGNEGLQKDLAASKSALEDSQKVELQALCRILRCSIWRNQARSTAGTIRLPASMEPIPNMNEDDHIKEFLRFMSKGELIRLAEIGLAIEMHQAAQRFFHGRTGVPYTEETAAKLQAYLELNQGGYGASVLRDHSKHAITSGTSGRSFNATDQTLAEKPLQTGSGNTPRPLQTHSAQAP